MIEGEDDRFDTMNRIEGIFAIPSILSILSAGLRRRAEHLADPRDTLPEIVVGGRVAES